MEMERVITIEEDGDRATYERRLGAPPDGRVIETKTIDLAALVPDEGGLYALPSHCKFAESHEGLFVFVIEDEPAVRTIRWITEHTKYLSMKQRLIACGAHHAEHESAPVFAERLRTQRIFRLAFPYIVKVYLFAGDVLQSVSLWYRKKPLTSEHDGLLEPNLPNRYTIWSVEPQRYGELCLSEAARLTRGGSYADMIASAEAEWWGSAWTQDLTEDFFMDAERIAEVASPWEWERSSKADSPFPLRLPWRDAERTIGEVIRGLLRKTDAEPKVFSLFTNRVQLADPLDLRRDATVAGIKASTANIVEVRDAVGGHAVVRAGEVLCIEKSVFPGIADGSRFIIEWFGRDEGKGSRVVKLAGVDDPLPLVVEGHLLTGITREVAARDEIFEIAGVRLGPGTIVEIVNQHEWPHRGGRYHIVASARRGAHGELLAKFEGEGFYTVLGKGEVLFSGLHLLPREERDYEGYLAARAYRLGDGTEVNIGDRFFVFMGMGGTIKEIEVHRFFSLRNGDTARRFRATSGGTFELENGKGGLHSTLVPVSKSAIRFARWRDRVVRSGDLAFYGDTGPVRIERFSPRFADGSQWVRFHDGLWMPLIASGGKPVLKITLVPRIAIDADGGLWFGDTHYPIGARFNVVGTRPCFTVARYHTPDVGMAGAMDAGGQMITLIERGEWVKNKIQISFRARRRRNLTLVRGMRLRLTVDVPNVKKGSRFIISHFVSGEGGGWMTLVTACGRAFDLVPQNAVCFEARLKNVWTPLVDSAAPLKPRFSTKADAVLVSGLRVPWARGASSVPRERMVKFGTLVGADQRGIPIRVGDRVRVKGNLDFGTSTPLAKKLVQIGTVFTVVHVCRCGSLYLDAGQVVYDGESTDRFPCGVDLIPSHLRNDPTWWARLVWASARDCERVD